MRRDSLKTSFSSKCMKRKGGSHVEVMLSFLIFITFLAFLYSTLEPTIQLGATKQPVLDFLKFSLENEFYIERVSTTTFTLTITGITENCIVLTGNALDDLGIDPNQDKLIIKDIFENKLNYSESGNQLGIGPLREENFNEQGELTLKIFEGDAFTHTEGDIGAQGGSGVGGCKSISCTGDTCDYTINAETTEEEISQSKIFALISEYDSGPGSDSYELLKEELGIPESNDFWFSFELADGTIIEPLDIVIPNVDVYATILPVQYTDAEANLQIGYMNLKVW